MLGFQKKQLRGKYATMKEFEKYVNQFGISKMQNEIKEEDEERLKLKT